MAWPKRPGHAFRSPSSGGLAPRRLLRAGSEIGELLHDGERGVVADATDPRLVVDGVHRASLDTFEGLPQRGGLDGLDVAVGHTVEGGEDDELAVRLVELLEADLRGEVVSAGSNRLIEPRGWQACRELVERMVMTPTPPRGAA